MEVIVAEGIQVWNTMEGHGQKVLKDENCHRYA